MPLVNMKSFLQLLEEKNLIAPAFNTTNLEMTLSIIRGAEEAGLPVIVQIAPTNVKLSGYDYIANIVKSTAEKVEVPVTLHLDHGMTFEDVKNAVEAGFNSVMIDASKLPYEENIQFTREVVEYCHARGVSVEAELGELSGKEDDHESDDSAQTDPNLAREFVERTGIDLLAVSVGNIHGLDEQPKINLELLREIADTVEIPLVIHGGSGIPDDILKQLKNYNVRKINLASDLRKRFIASVGKRYEQNPNEYNLISVLLEAQSEVKEVVINKFSTLNR
ncbi:class II aldolase [Peribacillus castrilensis]|uniref:Tagatose-bisphosphate aldolase n=1 Tax=Peribacillus simplex TaxID=1478 RepID=A0AAN2PGI9_9BACI|nr:MULTISPECIES: class II aldolase [Peribacillus]MBD8588570.1 class II aldolase [Peribacillus simplex]MCP1152724.1 class II aldolase [Peribacillus frigoritolerans]MCT1388441.1 class II aldolase [Peribacillus frigoritolerans]MEA3576709.1 class II aldolase [Peribacillus frigoritolerans]MEB2629306.1 class II aldolase [Peribacillus frigoritolerans]